jgi:hypothetical protein
MSKQEDDLIDSFLGWLGTLERRLSARLVRKRRLLRHTPYIQAAAQPRILGRYSRRSLRCLDSLADARILSCPVLSEFHLKCLTKAGSMPFCRTVTINSLPCSYSLH